MRSDLSPKRGLNGKRKDRGSAAAVARRSLPPGYEQLQGEIAIRMGRFFIRYFTRLYHEFDGDLALVIVLGEIGHHNTCHHYATSPSFAGRDSARWFDPERWNDLLPCNAFSLSEATGIPRETVRRKIATLIERGWVERNAKGEVFIKPAVAEHFTPEFNVQTLQELLTVGDELRALLGTVTPGKTHSTGRPTP